MFIYSAAARSNNETLKCVIAKMQRKIQTRAEKTALKSTWAYCNSNPLSRKCPFSRIFGKFGEGMTGTDKNSLWIN